MPQEIARDADTTWLERRNRRRGAMPKQVRRDGLSKRGARAVRYHTSDSVCSERAACPAGPERAMLVGTWKHRAHLSEIYVQIRHEWLRYGDFEVPSRLRFRAVEDHAPFFSNSPQVCADTNQRKSSETQRSACKQSDHQPVPIVDEDLLCSRRALAPFISFIPKAISRGVVTILSAFERGRRSLASRATMRERGSGTLPGNMTRMAPRNFSKYACCPIDPAVFARWFTYPVSRCSVSRSTAHSAKAVGSVSAR